LTDELATLEAALKAFERQPPKEDLGTVQSFPIEAHEVSVSIWIPRRDIESDLTAARLEEFHRRKAEMKEELSTRTAAIIQLCARLPTLAQRSSNGARTRRNPLDRRINGSLVRSNRW
jgi:hypothetical protein